MRIIVFPLYIKRKERIGVDVRAISMFQWDLLKIYDLEG